MSVMSSVALRSYLKPIQDILKDPLVNEITINRPNEYIIEKARTKQFIDTENFSLQDLNEFARLVASHTEQRINENTPMLGGNLPDGERVQIVMPPAVHHGMFAVSIRRPSSLGLSIDDYEERGAFSRVKEDNDGFMSYDDELLLQLKEAGKIGLFLKAAVRCKKNIIVSGGTSSGKTTFTNALTEVIDLDERLISVEDVQEVKLKQRDKLHLIYSKGGQGTSKVTAKESLEACLRLNPDRILLSELRGEEAFYYLRGINSGHPGSITTLHADTVRGCFDQIVMMIKQGGVNLSEEYLTTYSKKVVDIVVQFKNIKGDRVMTDLYYKPEGKRRPEAKKEPVNLQGKKIHAEDVEDAIVS